jgi:PAS domain S-box-containing protein
MADLPEAVSAFAQATDAVVVVDHTGDIQIMSAAAEELFGVSIDDIAGESVELLVPADRRFGHQAYRRGYLAEPSDREMDPGLNPDAERPADGDIVPIAVRLEPVRSDDGKLYVAAHVTRRES